MEWIGNNTTIYLPLRNQDEAYLLRWGTCPPWDSSIHPNWCILWVPDYEYIPTLHVLVRWRRGSAIVQRHNIWKVLDLQILTGIGLGTSVCTLGGGTLRESTCTGFKYMYVCSEAGGKGQFTRDGRGIYFPYIINSCKSDFSGSWYRAPFFPVSVEKYHLPHICMVPSIYSWVRSAQLLLDVYVCMYVCMYLDMYVHTFPKGKWSST